MLCKGKTKSGRACKNKATLEGFCKLHHPVAISKRVQDRKSNDPTKKYRDIMKLSDPMKELRESMKFVDPMKEFRESIKFVDPMEQHRDMMKLSDPMKELRESMKFVDPVKEFRESMKFVDPMEQHRNMMKLSDPMKELRESMKFVDPMKDSRESMKFVSPVEMFKDALEATNLLGQFGKLQQQIKDLQSTVNLDSFGSLIIEAQKINSLVGITKFGVEPSINTDGTLSFLDDSVRLSSLQDVAENVIANVIKDKSANIVEAFERLIVEVKALKDPLIQKVLIQLIFPIIFSLIFAFFNPYADFNVKNYLNKTEKKQIGNQLNKAVVSHVHSSETLAALRYVSADILNVRQSNKTNGKLIGYLYFAQVVVVLEKQKDWTRVKWVDETGENSIEGWVFSRYLKKFK